MFIVLQVSPESDNRLLPLEFRPIFYFMFLYINNPLCNIFVCLDSILMTTLLCTLLNGRECNTSMRFKQTLIAHAVLSG